MAQTVGASGVARGVVYREMGVPHITSAGEEGVRVLKTETQGGRPGYCFASAECMVGRREGTWDWKTWRRCHAGVCVCVLWMAWGGEGGQSEGSGA